MLDVAIIGGGIGGLTLAHFCLAEGLSVQVLEAAPRLSEVGAGITVPPNAMAVLSRLGLSAAVRGAGAVIPAGEGWDVHGGRLSTFDMGEVEARLGHPMVGIHRARLQEILAEGLPAGVLRLGCRGQGYEALGDGAVSLGLETPAGQERLRARALVGADGLRSAIRGQLFPERQPRFAGQTSWRGIVAAEDIPEAITVTREIWGDGRRFGYLPIGGGLYYWFAVEDAKPSEIGDRRAPEAEQAHLLRLLADFPDPVTALLRHTPPEAILRTDIWDLPPALPWHSGPVGLMGDAAHATTPNLGQGGAQAIEDACVLGQALGQHREDPAAAFAAFEAIRGEKALGVVRQSWRFGKVSHWKNPLMRWLRNLAMRLTPPGVVRSQMEALYRLNF